VIVIVTRSDSAKSTAIKLVVYVTLSAKYDSWAVARLRRSLFIPSFNRSLVPSFPRSIVTLATRPARWYTRVHGVLRLTGLGRPVDSVTGGSLGAVDFGYSKEE